MIVGVFLSSSANVAPVFLSAAEQIGQDLARAGFPVLYGGSNMGCMGALAQGVLRERGRLIGVLPEMDFMDGIVQEGLTEKIVVSDLSERKCHMIDRSDAFLFLPGGLGTLDEIMEVLALRQVGLHTKPSVFYNFLGFWTPLLEALETFGQQRMISARLDELFVVLERPEDVLTYLNECHRN
jgi:uncharacterized protein (TIGR00730 family)